jgi:hypothetical protein
MEAVVGASRVEGGGKEKRKKVGKNFPAKNHILSFLAGKKFLPRAYYLVARILTRKLLLA